ncbi:plasma membrane heat shock protein [Spiromyces aspiralis]|uniref:Plasma membrane heat shock protein n=1 Tax=Spiromyces aspiralis TaxID=68401 RepID=A0ACC1I084_9FUNG|nr:plasma membrane heat shock protein [Spiromyces aspiralis]
MAIFKDPNHPFMVKLTKDLKKASDANPSHYGVFFAAGGHGTLWDYPKDTGLIRLAEDVYRRGGIVAAVCHGPAILPSIKDDSGKPIIRNKTVTGFTDQGEIIVGMDEVLKKAGVTYVNEAVEKAGGKYVEPPGGPLDDFSVADGRIITGTNPASATSTAYKVVEAFCG